MRNKEEILNDVSKIIDESGFIFTPSPIFIHLTFELLIDIRDEVHELNKSIGTNLLDLARES